MTDNKEDFNPDFINTKDSAEIKKLILACKRLKKNQKDLLVFFDNQFSRLISDLFKEKPVYSLDQAKAIKKFMVKCIDDIERGSKRYDKLNQKDK